MGAKRLQVALLGLACLLTASCQKYGISGNIAQLTGNWAEVKLPAGCVPKQIASEESSGVVVLCVDGRVFH